MFRKFSALLMIVFIFALSTACQKTAGNQTVSSGGTSEIANGIKYGRAFEAVNWGLPAVNTYLMYQAFIKAGGKDNQIAFWPGLFSWKNQTLTPNPDVIYAMPFINTETGPVVIEIPPADAGGSITGSIMDIWQMPLEDVGPAGADKGKGGKYLILPPDYKDKVPGGYIVLRSLTYRNYAILRSILKSESGEDITKAVNYAKRVKIYPLSDAVKPPQTVFLDVINQIFDSTIRYDISFCTSLNDIIQMEPWLRRDMVMINELKYIGIEKGKPFNPDGEAARILARASQDAQTWLSYRMDNDIEPFYPGTNIIMPVASDFTEAQSTSYRAADSYPLDSRSLAYYFAYSGIKRPGKGQLYLMSVKGKDNSSLDGSKNYMINIPAKAPVTQFWSVTLYDRENHALIKDMARASRSSRSTGLLVNSDGSVDLYFGPKAPAGREPNWIPTASGGKFEALIRFYGPRKALLDKSWKMTDIEEVK